MKPILKIKKRFQDAKLPEYGKKNDAGFDLPVCIMAGDSKSFFEDGKFCVTLKHGERRVFDTGLTFELPEGYEIQIRSRSGMACKHGIVVINSPGTIDQDYRGNIMVGLINLSGSDFIIKHGDRVAQAVLAPFVQANIVEVSEILEDTDRGAGGFGSTGV